MQNTTYPVPITFYYDFINTTDDSRQWVMHEFAVNGAKHLVLCDDLIRQILFRAPLIDKLQQEMADEGLTFVDAHAPFGPDLDMNCVNSARRRMAWARHKLSLEICAHLGVDTITIHVGNTNNDVQRAIPIETHFKLVCETLDEILPVAEKAGVTVAIENIWFTTNTPEFLLQVKEKFPTDALGFCYDAGHANLMSSHGKEFPEGNAGKAWGPLGLTPSWDDGILEKMLPHLVNCHLHDNNGNADYHRNIGNGNINWQHISALLKQAPRLKNIQSEVIPCRTQSAIKDICAAMFKLFPEAEGL